MWSRKANRTVPWIVGVLILALLTLTSCLQVEVVDTTPFALAPDDGNIPSPAASVEHNLAVSAVGFDPPLDYRQLINHQQSIALLVSIENRGSLTEWEVTVRAQLSTPEDEELLFTQGASLSSIEPGEVQVVRFTRLGDLPYHELYHLEVVVDPVAGENDLTDNQKAFDIQIRRETVDP